MTVLVHFCNRVTHWVEQGRHFSTNAFYSGNCVSSLMLFKWHLMDTYKSTIVQHINGNAGITHQLVIL